MCQTWCWFSIKILSYQYKKSYCEDKTILRPSYLHNGIFFSAKMAFSIWIMAQVSGCEEAILSNIPQSSVGCCNVLSLAQVCLSWHLDTLISTYQHCAGSYSTCEANHCIVNRTLRVAQIFNMFNSTVARCISVINIVWSQSTSFISNIRPNIPIYSWVKSLAVHLSPGPAGSRRLTHVIRAWRSCPNEWIFSLTGCMQ